MSAFAHERLGAHISSVDPSGRQTLLRLLSTLHFSRTHTGRRSSRVAETTLDLRHLPKQAAYDAVEAQITAVLDGVHDSIAAMSTMSCILSHAFGHLWAGFYRVVERDRLLRVGPYQGSLGCLEIRFGQGVCGTAAKERRTVVVDDVLLFPGHIACDARSRSEIVVPVCDSRGELIAVLDIDSSDVARFDDVDRVSLERLVAWFADPSRGISGSD